MWNAAEYDELCPFSLEWNDWRLQIRASETFALQPFHENVFTFQWKMDAKKWTFLIRTVIWIQVLNTHTLNTHMRARTQHASARTHKQTAEYNSPNRQRFTIMVQYYVLELGTSWVLYKRWNDSSETKFAKQLSKMAVLVLLALLTNSVR